MRLFGAQGPAAQTRIFWLCYAKLLLKDKSEISSSWHNLCHRPREEELGKVREDNVEEVESATKRSIELTHLG